MRNRKYNYFRELPIICDDNTWVWHFLQETLKDLPDTPAIKIASSASLRQSWARFKNASRIIIHWECKHRSGGAMIEEMLEINPLFDTAEHVIVLTSSPMREDVVYLSELGVQRVIRIRHKELDLRDAAKDLKKHLSQSFTRDPVELAWSKIHRALAFLSSSTPRHHIEKIVTAINKLQNKDTRLSARYLDALASVNSACGNFHKAEKLWHQSLDTNPNYFRAMNNLIKLYQRTNQPQKSLDYLQRMHNLNKSKILRLAEFGAAYLALDDDHRAEHYFKRALSCDAYCSGALNGLAEIRFRQNDLDAARQLLSRTSLAYQFAAQLNKTGINLVKQQRYEQALEHYTKAQYVLPQKEKGPKLFYNIGLCYLRWGKPQTAADFFKIALIKEPSYKKAQKLLDKALQSSVGPRQNAAS